MPTQFYLTNTAAPYTPATIRGAWDQTTGGSVTKALDSRKEGGGARTSVGVAETNVSPTWDVLMYRGVSGPLAAQTIAGTIDVVIAVDESSASADMNWHIHVYVTQGDSDTPRGTLLTDYTEALGVNEFPAARQFRGLTAPQTLSSLAISAGDRLVVEIGYISREASATSRTGTMNYGVLHIDTLVVLDDGAVGGTDFNTKAGFLVFSADIAESASVETRLTQALLLVVAPDIPVVGDPGGGGDPGTGTDPSDGGSLCGAVTPLVWVTVQTDAGAKTYAKLDVALDDNFKEGRLLSIGPIVRALSDQTGGFETASTTIVLNDTDRLLRGLANTGTLLNKRVDVYMASAAQIRAAGTPRRVASLIIRDFLPGPDLTFELQCEDYFGSVIGELGAPRKIPARLFTTTDFPNLPADMFLKAVPIGYGLLSDEFRGANGIGVAPCHYVGPRRLSDGLDWDEYVIFGHAAAAFQSWFASDLSDVNGSGPRPTKMDPALEGTEFLIPGHSSWTSIVGANTYVDYNSHRYTVIYARGQRSEDAKSGAVPMSINIGGIEDVGDGTGTLIDALTLQIQHFINNWWIQSYQTGAWFSIPTVNSYSRIKTLTFVDVQNVQILRIGGVGYVGGFILGADLAQEQLLDTLKQLLTDADMNLAVNRHGQIIASTVYNLTTPTKAFVDATDVVKGSFSVRRHFEFLANKVVVRNTRNYILDSRPDSARTSVEWYSEFYHYTTDVSDGTAIAAVSETRELVMEAWSLRDEMTADDVGAQLLARRAYGPIYATFKTDLCGLDVELGDNITLTHFQGMQSSGWTAKVLRVERMVLDPDAMTVEIEGQAV